MEENVWNDGIREWEEKEEGRQEMKGGGGGGGGGGENQVEIDRFQVVMTMTTTPY